MNAAPRCALDSGPGLYIIEFPPRWGWGKFKGFGGGEEIQRVGEEKRRGKKKKRKGRRGKKEGKRREEGKKKRKREKSREKGKNEPVEPNFIVLTYY